MSPQLFFIIALAPLTLAHMGGMTSSDPGPRVYCGRALSQMIDSLCFVANGGVEKRSDGHMYGAIIPPYYKEQDSNMIWPWMTHKSAALGTFRGKRFTSGGVADECCDKACSISELLQYC